MTRVPARPLALALTGLLGALVVLGSAAPAGAQAPDPAAPRPYADLLVETSARDLRLPLLSIPSPSTGVLGTASAARVAELIALQAAFAEAVQAALEEAERAAASAPRAKASGGDGGGSSSRGSCNGDFDCFKPCTLDIESDGNYGAISPGGTYRGAWQFDQPTWNGAVARAGYPEWSGRDPASAPPNVQDAAARQLYSERGNQPWGGRC